MPILNQKDFENAKRDIDDIGKSVNTEAIINPRWGKAFKSIPLIAKEGQSRITELNNAINQAAAAGAGANGWTDQLVLTWTGRTQNLENKNFTEAIKLGGVLNSGLAYRKRLVADIPFKYPDFTNIAPKLGQNNAFPQGFTFEPENNLIYLTVQSNSKTSIAVWDVSDSKNPKFVTIFLIQGVTYTNEGLIVKWEDGGRKLYFRSNSGKLCKLDITKLPAKGSVISSFTETPIPCGRNFATYGDYFIICDAQVVIGQNGSRGNIVIYDKNYNIVDSVKLRDASAGVNEGNVYESILPKIQGLAKARGGFVGNSGGSQNSGKFYENWGTIIWNDDGSVKSYNLISPQGFTNYVENVLGKPKTYIEAEGVYSDIDGRIYTLMLYHSSVTEADSAGGGILIFEEFSTHPDAYDFSKYAVYAPIAMSTANGIQPLVNFYSSSLMSEVNSYYNPFTQDYFKNWSEICNYMKACELTCFSYYQNSVATVKPLDLLGAQVPNYFGLIEFRNTDNNVFLVECKAYTGENILISLNLKNNTQAIAPFTTYNSHYVIHENPKLELRRLDDSGTVIQKGQIQISGSGNFGLYDNTYKTGWILAGDTKGEAIIDRTLRVGGDLHANIHDQFALGLVGRFWKEAFIRKVSYTSTVFDSFGSGSPDGVVTASVGSTYRRTNGGVNTTFYVKESGSGNTGWVAK